MARKVWRKNGTSWSAGKGLWGKRDGSWQVAKKAWVNSSGTWTQVWPPDMAFSAFNVVATTAEAGFTSSAITWTISTSVPGTVTIQRLAPGGSWTDWVTGLNPSAGTTTQVLTPANITAGTWTYRAKFIPTWEPTWLTYSSTDTVSVTVPTFTSFNVTATTGEIGYTQSLVSWTMSNVSDTPGTVTIQRISPVQLIYDDVVTGLAKDGSTTILLSPVYLKYPEEPSTAGTWTYRAVFVPTGYPSWVQYSSTDTVNLSNPSVSFSVTATTGEVYYTSSNMSWTVTSGHAGTVTLQRKLGTGGTWTDFATGLSKSSSGSYMLAPAGTANNGTWYYRAKFIPTVYPSWVHYSSEDNASLSYRNHGTYPTTLRWIRPDAYYYEDPYDLWFFTEGWTHYWNSLPIRVGATAADGQGTMNWNAVSQVSVTGIQLYHFYARMPPAYTYSGTYTTISLLCSTTSGTCDHEGTGGAKYWQWDFPPHPSGDWSYFGNWVCWDQPATMVWTAGKGFHRPSTATATVTFPDGQYFTRTVIGDSFVVAGQEVLPPP